MAAYELADGAQCYFDPAFTERRDFDPTFTERRNFDPALTGWRSALSSPGTAGADRAARRNLDPAFTERGITTAYSNAIKAVSVISLTCFYFLERRGRP